MRALLAVLIVLALLVTPMTADTVEAGSGCVVATIYHTQPSSSGHYVIVRRAYGGTVAASYVPSTMPYARLWFCGLATGNLYIVEAQYSWQCGPPIWVALSGYSYTYHYCG